MTEKEYELKRMLIKCKHNILLFSLGNFMVETGLQTNYYDIWDEKMRKRNMIVRVRQINNKLIGALKSHLHQYFAVVDYESKIEYLKPICKQAEEILMRNRVLLERVLKHESVSKSQRFFSPLSNFGGANYA